MNGGWPAFAVLAKVGTHTVCARIFILDRQPRRPHLYNKRKGGPARASRLGEATKARRKGADTVIIRPKPKVAERSRYLKPRLVIPGIVDTQQDALVLMPIPLGEPAWVFSTLFPPLRLQFSF